MNYDKNIYAEVVFDGIETHAPTRMGLPKDDQLKGSTLEQLSELAGRICYDSLGKGRSSEEYHKHIAQVGHGSVWEHANFTIEVAESDSQMVSGYLMSALNRPGIWVRPYEGGVRLSLNLRAAVEWGQMWWSDPRIACIVRAAANEVAPQIAKLLPDDQSILEDVSWRIVPPNEREEKWVSLLLGGSRGMSHEQVRHKFRTAVSQRSTRYVDESASSWVRHPLLDAHQVAAQARCAESFETPEALDCVDMFDGPDVLRVPAVQVYDRVVGALQPWLEAEGADAHTARKQARGAARGYLGNALATEMIFSASVVQWRRMIEQRCTIHADAEIRVLYGKILQALRTTKWADDFADYTLIPSPDGIGEVIE